MSDRMHVGLPEDQLARLIEQLAGGGFGQVLLSRYCIGDSYETECVASMLTVSPQHTPQLRRDGKYMAGVTYFAPPLIPPSYRDRVTDTGVVLMMIRFELADVTAVAEGSPPPTI